MDQEKREKANMFNTKDEKEPRPHVTKIKKIIRGCWLRMQLEDNTFENLDEMDKVLEKYNPSKPTQEEIKTK